MFENIMEISSNSWLDQAFRLGLFLVAASLLIALAVKLAMSAKAMARVRAQKEWQEPAREEEIVVARVIYGDPKQSISVDLLHEDVKLLLEQASNPALKGRSKNRT